MFLSFDPAAFEEAVLASAAAAAVWRGRGCDRSTIFYNAALALKHACLDQVAQLYLICHWSCPIAVRKLIRQKYELKCSSAEIGTGRLFEK